MKKTACVFFLIACLLQTTAPVYSQTISGDINLQDVSSGKSFSFSSLSGAKGIVVFFTSEHCPYAKLYEKRIVTLAAELKGLGIHTVLVNPNDGILSPDDAVEKMKGKSYPFPYLADKQQQCVKMFNAQKTPEVFLIKASGSNYELVYQGAFDDNPMSEEEVTETYLANAARALAAGKAVAKKVTRPTGCMIKSRQ
ncbi:MAG: redoxin domain-containing protein [Imperialibacter sp.]|uniref:redoxin domain-containing protein n=1 Tax=Imperialibacter sp. TaxID=2038411 RepID=UPI0030DBA46F